eukprot:2702519-Pyramimonas_sp.AAC.1
MDRLVAFERAAARSPHKCRRKHGPRDATARWSSTFQTIHGSCGLPSLVTFLRGSAANAAELAKAHGLYLRRAYNGRAIHRPMVHPAGPRHVDDSAGAGRTARRRRNRRSSRRRGNRRWRRGQR